MQEDTGLGIPDCVAVLQYRYDQWHDVLLNISGSDIEILVGNVKTSYLQYIYMCIYICMVKVFISAKIAGYYDTQVLCVIYMFKLSMKDVGKLL